MKTIPEDPKALRSEVRKLRKALEELVATNLSFLTALDIEMKQEATPERGRRIARLCNALDMATDRVRYFRLGVDYRTDDKSKLKPLEVPEARLTSRLSAALAAPDPEEAVARAREVVAQLREGKADDR